MSRCLQSSPLLSFSAPVDTVSSLPISGRGEKGQLNMARHFERELLFTVFILAYCYDGSILLRRLQFSNLSTKPHHKYVVREKPRLGESVLCSYCPSCVRWTLQMGADSISMTQCESAQDTHNISISVQEKFQELKSKTNPMHVAFGSIFISEV